MKLLWFHLMPYTDLPDDFKQKHASVWVDIDSRLFDPRKAHVLYNEFMDELEHAAEIGFHGICVNEHHSNAYGLMPSPNLIAASLARRTRDAAIVVMGNSLALYNPPTRVAEEMAMIDCISGGRLVAGFPVGTPMDTCFAYGQNPSQLRQRYHEAHDLILRAWQDPDPFTWNGRFHKLRYVNVWPRPLQKPHPPVWIPGGGSIETWRWCAERDYVYSYLSYFGYKNGEATMQGFWDEMQRLGKDPNPYRAGFLQFVGVAETREEALALYREPAEYFYGRCLHLDPRYALAPGYASEATQRARVRSAVADAAARSRGSGGRPGDRLRGDRRPGLRDRRLPGRGGRAAARGGREPERRPPDAAAAVRQHESPAHAAQHRALREARAAAARGSLRRRVGGPLVAARAARRGSRAAARDARMSPPRERHVQVNGRRCRVWEKGEGEPLGFLGGLRGLPRWPRFLDRLAERRRVIAPSLPGFPGATGFDELDDLADWVTATLDLLEASGLDGADLIGASVGATLAAEVAAFSRATLRRLVLIAPFGLFDEREPVRDLWATRPDELPALLSTRPTELAAFLAPPAGEDAVEWSILIARASEAAARLLWPTRGSRSAQAAAPHPGADAGALGRRGPRHPAELRQALRRRARRLGRGARDRGRRAPGRARPARRGRRRDRRLPHVTPRSR